jgi:uncharacterized protein YcfL
MLKYFIYSITALLLLSACGGPKKVAVEIEQQLHVDHIISNDTTWSGEVLVEGVVNRHFDH